MVSEKVVKWHKQINCQFYTSILFSWPVSTIPFPCHKHFPLVITQHSKGYWKLRRSEVVPDCYWHCDLLTMVSWSGQQCAPWYFVSSDTLVPCGGLVSTRKELSFQPIWNLTDHYFQSQKWILIHECSFVGDWLGGTTPYLHAHSHSRFLYVTLCMFVCTLLILEMVQVESLFNLFICPIICV